MLQKIGNRTKTVLGFLLFIPIIGSFLIWGISDMLRAAGVVRYAATVGNTTISTQEFERDVRRQADGLKRQGVKVSGDMLRQMGIANQVLRSEIERELLRQAARDNGIVIADQTVAAKIQTEKAFQDDSGKFSRDKFKTILANAGMGEREFVSGLRDDMAIQTLVAAITAPALPPEALPVAAYSLQKTKYSADIYALPHDALANSPAPQDKELQDFYAAHQDMYQLPELRRGLLAVLSIKDFAGSAAPSDQDLKNLYDAKKVEFAVPEERSVQFITVPGEAEAKTIAERARGGEKLAAAASTVMGKPVPLKTMNDLRAGTLPPDLDKAIFKLPRGETSEPVNTALGWYVVQITNIKAGIIPPLERVKDKLIAAWKMEQASDALPKTLNKLDDAIAGGDTLENLAKTYHMQLRPLPLLDANGNGDAALSNNTDFKPVLSAMFKQKSGEVGNVFELPGGDYALLRVDEIRPAHIPAFAEIKGQITQDWRKFNARQLAEDTARKFADDWRKSDKVADLADKIGAQLSTQTDISRAASEKQSSAIDRAILKAGAVNDVVMTTDGNAEYIAKIRSIIPPDKSTLTPLALTDSHQQATAAIKKDYVQIYLNALEKHYAVEVNEKAVKQVEGAMN